ncbi:MAG: DUF4190 domain-containing protein [Planctomycetes bacterium]|nr:DUF4190 domain-containing protein [Planctomycetota bacterium]
MHKANKGFYVGAFLAGSLGHWIIWEVTQVLGMAYPQLRPIFQMLRTPASLLTILSSVVTFILIYKMWAAIQDRGARTSAGKALGFMFIPFFNFYWLFEVYWGWTKDYNRIPESDDVELPLMPEGIGLAVCVLPLLSMCLMFASFFGGSWKSFAEAAAVNVVFQASMLISLVNTILMAILFSKICDGINALVDAGLEPPKPQYALPAEDAKTSGMAIASLVLGICGIVTCGLTAVIGLILGIVGLCAISKRAEQLKGKGFAIAGIITSAISIVLTPGILMALLMPALFSARTQAMNMVSMTYAKQICLAMAMYCDENNGSFPPVDNWPAALNEYISDEKILTSPFAPEAGRAWAMNKNLDGRKKQDIKQTHRIVLIFEARFDSSPAGGCELLPESPRTRRGYAIGFIDGHVKLARTDGLDELILIPDTQGFEVAK